GKPYDPATGQGVVGRNYTYQSGVGMTLFYENKHFAPFMGAGALCTGIDDYNGDNFDHSGLDFIGGGVVLQSQSGGRPIQFHPTPRGTPRWGGAWKAAVAKYYNSAIGIGAQGSVQAYRWNDRVFVTTYKNQF